MMNCKELTFLKGVAKGAQMLQLQTAIELAQAYHNGQLRLTGEEYIIHPVRVASALYSLGVRDEVPLTVAILHDIIEDTAATVNTLVLANFEKDITYNVKILTKDKDQEPKDYYRGISKEPIASLVKIADRCHNVSTMSDAFTPEKIKEYVEETTNFVIPLIKPCKRVLPQYSDALFYMRYHLESMVALAKKL